MSQVFAATGDTIIVNVDSALMRGLHDAEWAKTTEVSPIRIA